MNMNACSKTNFTSVCIVRFILVFLCEVGYEIKLDKKCGSNLRFEALNESFPIILCEHIRHKGYGESMTWNLLDGCVLEGEDDFRNCGVLSTIGGEASISAEQSSLHNRTLMVGHGEEITVLWDPSHQRESLEVGFDECATRKRGIGSCSNNQTAEETGARTTYVYQLVESVDLRLC
ncbi:hypothetical protein TNCT_343411 [Trichonephila clavata]|uniref:Uncharacterized protein n=1 Tax=Trichonephila clavata TaxID=2740835 RepID=A0A8X6F956_TRICU|nr:hypothetical protein TNCT_343411 [Trichonephila clavata]